MDHSSSPSSTSRKRQRSRGTSDLTPVWKLIGWFVFASGGSSGVQGFSLIRSFSSFGVQQKESELYFASSTTAEEDLIRQQPREDSFQLSRRKENHPDEKSNAREEEAQQQQTKTSIRLPKWLENYSDYTSEEVDREVRWLEYALLEQGFAIKDISTIVRDMCRTSEGDDSIKVGMVDFLNLVLSLRESVDGGQTYFASTPVLRACILHYADCVVAQRQGVPKLLRKFLRKPNSEEESINQPCSLLVCCGNKEEENFAAAMSSSDVRVLPSSLVRSTSETSLVPFPFSASPNLYSEEEEVDMIVKGAAKIKRAELLIQAVLRERASSSTQPEKVRDFLLSIMEDWRSLGIRAVACLYRLEGLLEAASWKDEFLEQSPEVVNVAREALRIYAPLAQRLGLHSLKARIEANAFRILYRRQYQAAAMIYQEGGEAMRALSAYLLPQITNTLRSDDALMSQLEDLQVLSRVKEPYSFWKKLLKSRMKGTPLLSPEKVKDDTTRSSLSVTQVNDGVALRVIVKAKKLTPDESDETTHGREALLCYYVQELIRRHWPETDPARLKDYIANPKPNGYQSLHHTSQLSIRGVEFPFEVQVRSEEMHRLAEFGYAAHWSYKLNPQNRALEKGDSASVKGLPLIEGSLKPHDDGGGDNDETSEDEETNPYIDALVIAKETLNKQKAYVFVVGGGEAPSSGRLLSVPVDSPIQSVVDDIENSESAKVQVWRNGRLADPSDVLDNGDVLMIAL